MQSKDLRFGNYVESNFYKGKLTAWNNDKCVIKHKAGIEKCDVDNLKPILLRENWLIDFGFIKRPFQGKDFFVMDNIELSFSEIGVFKGWVFNMNENDLRGVHYVHQLQNLYFALTGEELELKSESKP